MAYKNHDEKLVQIKAGALSLVDNVTSFLKRIKENVHLNAFNFVFEEDSHKTAETVQEKILSGNHGKLAGMVIAVKDVLAIKDKPLTCSSSILKNFTSVYTSTAIQKLIDEDAIIIGKTNCDEFAMGSSNENSAFGPVKNPYDITKVPGGSSGGSAAALAANLCDVSIGTDTGGSIRQPASFCGLYGLKPTYGRVSRFGLTAYASSFDSIGPFTNSLEDISKIMEVISGVDPMDSTSSRQPVPVFNESEMKPAESFTVGIPDEYISEGINEEIKETTLAFIEKLKAKGINVKSISLPNTEYTIATYYILTTAEASSNLSRFDGVRYSERAVNSSLDEMYKQTRDKGFGDEVKRRIILGTYVLSAGYYDAYYKKAQKVRRLIKQDFENAFKEVDFIVTPVSPVLPFNIGEKIDDPLTMYMADIYTTSANLAGIPGLTVPAGKSKTGLPIGIQLLANEFKEKELIAFAKIAEEN